MTQHYIQQLLDTPESAFEIKGKTPQDLVYPIRTPKGWRGCNIQAVDDNRDLINEVLDLVPDQYRGATNPDGSMRYFWLRDLERIPTCPLNNAALGNTDYMALWGRILPLGAATGRLFPVIPPYTWTQITGVPPLQLRERHEAWTVPQLTVSTVQQMELDLYTIDVEVRSRLREKYGMGTRPVRDAITQYYSILPDALFIQVDTAMRERAAEQFLNELNEKTKEKTNE